MFSLFCYKCGSEVVCARAIMTCCEVTEPPLKKAGFIFRHVTSVEKDKKLWVPIREANLRPSAPALRWFTTRPQSLIYDRVNM